MVVDNVTAKTVMPIVHANVAHEAVLMTDESNIYRSADKHFSAHGTTNHSAGQYVDYEMPVVQSNTGEGYFSIFKRGMKGFISLAPKAIRTAISQSSSSGITIGRHWAAMTPTGLLPHCKALSASG